MVDGSRWLVAQRLELAEDVLHKRASKKVQEAVDLAADALLPDLSGDEFRHKVYSDAKKANDQWTVTVLLDPIVGPVAQITLATNDVIGDFLFIVNAYAQGQSSLAMASVIIVLLGGAVNLVAVLMLICPQPSLVPEGFGKHFRTRLYFERVMLDRNTYLAALIMLATTEIDVLKFLPWMIKQRGLAYPNKGLDSLVTIAAVTEHSTGFGSSKRRTDRPVPRPMAAPG